MKILFRNLTVFLILCAWFYGWTCAYAVMPPFKADFRTGMQELKMDRENPKAEKSASSKTDEYENLKSRHLEIRKKISELEEQDKQCLADLEKLGQEGSK